MPTRLVREGILTSQRVNQLSVPAEVFYRRLMSVVDDYGRYFAHPALLRASCYPLRLDTTTERQISEWLEQVVAVGLVTVYDDGTTKYLEIQEFRQRKRYDSKYPDPPHEKTVLKTVLESDLKTVRRTTDPHCDPPTPVLVLSTSSSTLLQRERFDAFWAAYPRKVGKGKAREVWMRLKPGEELHITILAAVETQKLSRQWNKDEGQYIPHPSTWLQQERWHDVLEVVTPQTEAERRKRAILDAT